MYKKNSGMISQKTYPIVLSIAGSDSSGGAGIQADLKTFSALGVYGATAITAITAQNTQGVNSQYALNPQMVYEQIIAVIDDLQPSVVKIGMLSNAEIVRAVAEALSKYSATMILDPVMVSSSGHRLLSIAGQEVVKEKLLPMSTLITPNIPEMEALTGMPLSTHKNKERASRFLLNCGANAVLIKGGHEEGDVKTDILYSRLENGELQINRFAAETIPTKNVHGTGCTLSSAIAAFMARGYLLNDAVLEAKRYVSEAIRAGADVKIGYGFGPVNHGFNPCKMIINNSSKKLME